MTKTQIIAILRNLSIPYWIEGKNVSEDAININCPFCLEEGMREDPSNHLGILPDNYEVFNCWRCGKSGPFIFLLRKLTNYSEKACQEIIDETSEFSECRDIHSALKEINSKEFTTREKGIRIVGLPEYFELITKNIDCPMLFKYLDKRQVSLDKVIQHGCGICRVGKYMNRMVIPIFHGGKVVAFQAADLTGQSDLKYLSSDNLGGYFLYNYDNVEVGCERLVIVEGILDSWRTEGVEPSVVASFTVNLTDYQKNLIIEKSPREFILAFDNDAFWLARKVAHEFVPFIEKVRIVQFPSPSTKIDPDSYGRDYGTDLLLEVIDGSVCIS